MFLTHAGKRLKSCNKHFMRLLKGRIRVIYDKLSQKIDAGIIGKHLYQQGALNNKEKEEIQRLSNRPTAAAEQLLDIVLSQTEDFYDCFLDSLSKTDQIDVRQWIILQGLFRVA